MDTHGDWTRALRQMWLWPVAVLVGFPIGGYIADLIVGGVDSVGAALAAGLIAGAIFGAAEWFVLRRWVSWIWIPATAAGTAAGLAAGVYALWPTERDIVVVPLKMPTHTSPSGMRFVLLRGGDFQMGSLSEEEGREKDERRHAENEAPRQQHGGDRDIHERACDRDPQLVARHLGHPLQPGDASDRQQGDVARFDAVSPRRERVTELVQHDTAE